MKVCANENNDIYIHVNMMSVMISVCCMESIYYS